MFLILPKGSNLPLDENALMLLTQKIHALDDPFWYEGSMPVIEASISEGEDAQLLIIGHKDHGVYLKCIIFQHGQPKDELLSLGDGTRLSEVVECEDEWFASTGLFIASALACSGIEHFVHTNGQLSPSITWIRHSDLPPEGNS